MPVSFVFAPPRSTKKQTRPKYHRLPDDLFKNTTAQCRLLPILLQQVLTGASSVEEAAEDLETMRAFFHAFVSTFPRCYAAHSASQLKKSKHAGKLRVVLQRAALGNWSKQTSIALRVDDFQSTSDDRVYVPARALAAMVRISNDLDALGRNLDQANALRHSLLGRPVSLKHWERFRLLSPKASGSLNRLVSAEGHITDVEGLATAVMAGRDFWTVPPTVTHFPCDSMPLLAQSPISDLPAPPLQLFHKCFATSIDTSPGIDGIPYSAFRATWQIAALLLYTVFMHIASHGFPITPTQLLVWIPKAIIGELPDNWRPLSMPRVFDRLIDKVVFAHSFDWFASVLRGAQSLVGLVKDPQFNYLLAQTFLSERGPLKSALLIDLAKAFERVNVFWLMHLLQQYGAPGWLRKYFAWVFTKRTTVPKILNHLASPLVPTVGLDMGRACSVLLFCLSIDPLVRQVNTLQLPVLRAYMDDATLAKIGIDWIGTAQNAFLVYEKVGIVVDQQECCLFSPSQGDHPPQLGAKGLSSWFRAAIDALAAHPECLSFTTKGCPVVLTRSDLLQITDRTPLGNLILAQLAAITCHCKAKTTVVPSRQLSVDEVLILDNAPFGAKVIKDQDVTL